MIKIYFYPGVDIDEAIAELTIVQQTVLPLRTTPQNQLLLQSRASNEKVKRK